MHTKHRAFSSAFVLTLALTFTATNAFAGQFSIRSFTSVRDVAGLVTDLVTDKFTRNFPVSKYEIILISESTSYRDGSGVTFAFAGMSPIGTDRMPKYRHSASSYKENVGGSAGLLAIEKGNIRSVVEALITACDENPSNCLLK